MKNTVKGMTLATIAGLSLATNAQEASPIQSTNHYPYIISSVYADASVYSMYLGTFGFSNSKGAVSQDDLGFNVGPISYNLWENFDFDKKQITEVDHSLSWTYATKHLSLTPKFIYFEYPQNNDKNAYDADLTVATKGYPLDLRLEMTDCFGKGANEGRLAQFGVSKKIKLTSNINLLVDGNITYNDKFYAKESDLSHAATSAKANIDLGYGFTLSPSIRYQKAIDSMNETFKSKMVYGINLNKSF